MPKITYSSPRWLIKFSHALDAWENAGCEDEKPRFTDFVPSRTLPKIKLIWDAADILEEYAEQGYELTLRQLYYQFVSRDLIANNQKEYNRLGDAVNDGRMWGFLDWDHIVDRGRNLEGRTTWESPHEIIEAVARSFHTDWWQDCDVRPEVWVEKQALEEVIEKAAKPFDVSYLACKGYTSQSEMWAAAMRIKERYKATQQQTLIIHLGDHDPSGIDMTRDIEDRLYQFDLTYHMFDVHRIALTMDQVEEHQPPPNPAKKTDARFQDYQEKYGDESWELDALEPRLLHDLIEEAIKPCLRLSWHQRREEEEQAKEELKLVADNWDAVSEWAVKEFD